MKAVILAGGFGTRLQSVVAHVPKPMAPINGTPFLALFIRHLKTQGISHVILATHYMHEVIEDYFGPEFEGTPIIYAREEQPLHAGGAIVNAIHIANLTEPFFIINGDTFIKVDYRAIHAQHTQTHATVTTVLRHLEDAGGKGVVEVEDGRIVKFGASGEPGKPGLINAGISLFHPSLLTEYPVGQPFSFEKDFLQPRIPGKVKPHAYITSEFFIDFGTPSEYARAQIELQRYL